MRAKTERGVEGAHRIPAAGAQLEQDHTTACGGVDSPGRTSKCRRRTTRRLSSLSVFNALREDVFCSNRCKSTALSRRCTCPESNRTKQQIKRVLSVCFSSPSFASECRHGVSLFLVSWVRSAGVAGSSYVTFSSLSSYKEMHLEVLMCSLLCLLKIKVLNKLSLLP